MALKYSLVMAFLFLTLACQSNKPKEAAVASDAPVAGSVAEPTPNITSQEVDDGPQAGDELNPIYFDYNSSNITSGAVETLKRNAEQLRKTPKTSIQVEGHCDQRGSDEYNFLLGERRATAAKNFLVKMGIESGRIKIISYGKDKPADGGTSEAAYAKSRRASFVFLHQ